MNVTKLSRYIFKNDLSENQITKILTDLKREIFDYGYRRGYWARDADLKKIRNTKNKRLKEEFETKELNQDK